MGYFNCNCNRSPMVDIVWHMVSAAGAAKPAEYLPTQVQSSTGAVAQPLQSLKRCSRPTNPSPVVASRSLAAAAL
jgi:hypothetical protein